MLTLQDCLELCELTEDEVLAIAEHENLTEIAALEFGNYLVHTPEGERRIKAMIVEDIDAARAGRRAPRCAAQAGSQALRRHARRSAIARAAAPVAHWRPFRHTRAP
jgi:hypothetical protein